MNRKFLISIVGILLLFSFACKSLNQVTPKQWDDAAIEAEVRKNLTEDVDMKAFGLSVKVSEGVVTLDGHVNTEEQRTKAGEGARGVEGVKRVINNITVQPK